MIKKLIFLFSIFIYNIFASSITPIPQSIKFEKNKALLGKKLFFDPRLSANNTIACVSCHDISHGGVDNLKTSIGINGKIGDINAPTVFNAFFNFSQHWDGRSKTLEEQALGPIQNLKEMGSSLDNLIEKLRKTSYKKEFKKIYKDGLTKKNLANAIAEFEKTLITPNSRFDKYLRGDTKALTTIEIEGFELFKSKGCISCHHGVNIGANQYNKFGAISEASTSDFGRFNVTGNEDDKYYFKVPTLRNIALTSPYYHDGRYYNLFDTVANMADIQLGREISNDEIKKIVAFLKTLTGEVTIIE